MPTYDYRCSICGHEESVVQTIAQYSKSPIRPTHCGHEMQRKLSVVPGAAIGYALAGDRHYDGLRAVDGADISTRSKHRAYMASKGVTMSSDFTQTWAKAAKERQEFRQGKPDATLRKDVAEIVHKASQTA